MIKYTREHGGIEYAQDVMEDYYRRCMDYVDSNITDASIANSLRLYVDFVVGRES